MSALQIDDLVVRFGATVAVDHVDLDLATGQVLAVLGPSGCGKSSLLRAVAGLERPAAGSIRFAGADLAGVPTHKRGFALMFQDGQLFEHLDVAGNVGYALRIRGRRDRARVAELLDLVGLTEHGARMPSELSGGERQRVALARALAVDPRMLLLDEPLSALDANLRERLAGDLRRILHESGTTAVLVTHDQDEAFAIADRIAVMRHGRLVQEGTLEQVWRRPVDAQTARFLGYATVLPAGQLGLDLGRDLEPGSGQKLGQKLGPDSLVALRRSALRVEDPGADGGLVGTLVSVRTTPEQLRCEVALDGVGTLPAVAPLDRAARVGERVGLRVDRTRLAVIGDGSDRGGGSDPEADDLRESTLGSPLELFE